MTPTSMQFYDFRRSFWALWLLAVIGIMSGCASNTIDQAVPEAASSANGPVNTGQYPNINVVPSGETAQLTDEETVATRAGLENEAQVLQQRGESPEAYVARLRKLQQLGSTHAAATLKQIESGQ